jgi:uncharacterized NAD(P)/FAD-binding protein YdhS
MEAADILIIGSGIACTSTLVEVFKRLLDNPRPHHKLKITVIEKHEEFWLGVPYGSRSSLNALTITSISDFFTDENERSLFFSWFKQNKNTLLTWYRINGGQSAEQWFERNKTTLETEDWKNLYMPRYICGKYQQDKFDKAFNKVKEKGLADLNLIHAEATDVLPKNGGYEVTYETAEKGISIISAGKVVLATGSAPIKDIELPADSNFTLINDLYSPGAIVNIKKLATVLSDNKDEADRNVLLVGSNASSIEFLYLLAGLPNVINLINNLVVISKSGLLPYHIIKGTTDNYPADHLDRVKADGNYTIETLIEAAKKDINAAVKDGVIIPHIDKIIGYTIQLLQPLSENDKKAFIGIYGMQLSNLFRRSGTDYKTGEGLLQEAQKLTLLKGAFSAIDKDGGLQYITTDKAQIYPDKFKVVINCTGANDLDQSSSKLIHGLVHNHIARVNLSGKGFLVNEHFEAAPNLYVIGPLLGGNKNERIHFWHLENASRIMYLAPYLAECLVL